MSGDNHGNNTEEARLLLPWYITGKLNEAERRLVEKALEEYPELRHEYQHELKMVDMIRGNAGLLNLKALDTTEHRLGKLMRRIEQEQATASQQKPQAATTGSGKFSLRGFLRNLIPSTDWLTPANAVFATLLVIQAALIGWTLHDKPTDFFTVTSTDENQGQTPVQGMALLVGFNDDARLGEVNDFLKQWNARIFDGPDAGNLFRIELRDNEPGSPQSKVTLQQIKKNQQLINFIGQEN